MKQYLIKKNFNQLNIPNYIWIIIAFIGLLNYIPIFYYPDFLNLIYYNHKLLTIILPLMILIFFFLFSSNKKKGTIIIWLYIITLLFSHKIRDWDNLLIINYNSEKEQKNFRSPILGYKIEKEKNNINDIPFDLIFKFNDTFGTYEALVFKKNHGLNIDSFDGDYSLYKIYNQNWWWYKKGD